MILALALIVVVLGAGAITVALTRSTSPAGPAGHGTAGSGQAGSRGGTVGAAAAVRRAAATWVASQVAAAAIVACDPAMCPVLQSKGVPAGRLEMMSTEQADPLGSDVIMATAALRNQFGSLLTSVYAPTVLASFGTGSAQVVIRVVAPDGAAAYLSALRSDVTARAASGSMLLRNRRIHASAAARRQLAAGQVDARLLTTLAALAAARPVQIVSFSSSGPGASPGMPLRAADLARAAGKRGGGGLRSLSAFFRAQRAAYLPAEISTVRLATGESVLHIQFSAPSPLGLLGPRS